MIQLNRLTMAEAELMVDAALAKAKELGVGSVICVSDAAGYPIVIKRPDNGKVTSVDIAINKAFTAACHKRPTHTYTNAQPNQEAFGIMNMHGGRFAIFVSTLHPNIAEPGFTQGFADVVSALDVARAFAPRRKILVVTGDSLTPRMAGPAIRAWQISLALCREHEVRLLSTVTCELTHPDFKRCFQTPPSRAAKLTRPVKKLRLGSRRGMLRNPYILTNLYRRIVIYIPCQLVAPTQSFSWNRNPSPLQ